MAVWEWPRHLHKGAGEYLEVQSDEALDAALADDWHLQPHNHPDRASVPDGAETPVEVIAAAPEPPKRRGLPPKVRPAEESES